MRTKRQFMLTTGRAFKEEHVLDDGTRITLRHVRPEDAEALKAAFEHLSPQSRYQRFSGVMGSSLSQEQLHYLTNVDGTNHVAIVATTTTGSGDGAAVGLGIGRFVRSADDPAAAEVALTVVDEMQHKGLGRILALALGRAALERGIRHFRGQTLADNRTVLNLLEEMGAKVRSTPGGEMLFDVDLAPS